MSKQKLISKPSWYIFVLCFTPSCIRFAGSSSFTKKFIIIDPLDEYNNANAALEACKLRGVDLLTMWSKSTARRLVSSSIDDSNSIMKDECPDLESRPIESWLSYHDILKGDLVGIICESDTGLRTAEILSHILNLGTSNGISEARRDKYMMQEALKRYGADTVSQILTDDWLSAFNFIQHTNNNKFPVVIKPCRGSASVGVYEAHNIVDAKEIFQNLLGTPGYANGTVSDAVLVQEYLRGVEYAVDTMSRNGEHKILCVWKYDKRPTNNAPFVYFCSELVTDYSNVDILQLMNYSIQTLDALDVKYGPAHIEIKFVEGRGPVLVEANIGRWHGQDFTPISNICFGYNAVEVNIDALLSHRVISDKTNNVIGPSSVPNQLNKVEDLDEVKNREVSGSSAGDDPPSDHASEPEIEAFRRWAAIPKYPSQSNFGARIVHLVSTVEGKLTAPPKNTEDILSLKSMFRWCPSYEGTVGEEVVKTIDLRTTAGYCLLLHPDKTVVDDDYEKLIHLHASMYIV